MGKFLQFTNYDKKRVKIPIPKNSWWFDDKRRGSQHCVVMCSNPADVFRISDNRLANLGYCFAHAELRIIKDLLHGITQRGLWCWVDKGKLVPFWSYRDFMPQYEKLYPEKAKKLKEKIKEYKKKPIKVCST